MDRWNYEQLSDITFKVVENDPYGQYPFLYVILGVDKCILIDTGTGIGNYCDYLTAQINKSKLPYFIINTHVHFDHVGGNHHFCKNSSCTICMGGNNKTFTENYEINSLAMAHNGASVGKFTVSNWLQEGDFIYLDDNNKVKEKSLEVIYTPGHTPDSIALYAHFENRLFVGDTIYPYTAIHLDSLGSNINDYIASIKKLIKFTSSVTKTELKPVVAQTSTVTEDPVKEFTKNEFLSVVGLAKENLKFNLDGLLELCDWSLDGAINMYLMSPTDVIAMCPPVAKKAVQQQQIVQRSGNDIVLSCGHVEANFSLSHLQQMLDMISVVVAGALPPQHRDGEYGEFTFEDLTIMLSMKNLSNVIV